MLREAKETKAVNLEGKHLVGPDWIGALLLLHV